MRLSEKLKTFSGLFTPFPKFALNLEHFEKKKSCIAQVFPKLLTAKDLFTSMDTRS